MSEKEETKIDESSGVPESPVMVVVPDSPRTDYGVFSSAEITVEGDDVIITVPVRHGVTTVRAHKAILTAWAADNVAGELLEEAKKYKP
jgi:hypothetical protein